MSKLTVLVKAAQMTKDRYAALCNEQDSTTNRDRYREIPKELEQARNCWYNAVHALNQHLKAETGLYGYQLSELFQTSGRSGPLDDKGFVVIND